MALKDKRIVVTGVAVASLVVMLMALQHESTKPSRDKEAVEEIDGDEDHDGMRVATRVARIAHNVDVAPPAGTKKITKQFEDSLVEDFDAQKLRAFGASQITGRVRARDEEADAKREQERQRERAERGDQGTSESRRFGRGDRGTSDSRGQDWGRWGREMKNVAGAEVLLYENDPNTTNPPLRTAITDEEGSFTLAQLHDGERRYILVVKATGYAHEATFVFLNNEPSYMDVFIEKGEKVTGIVRDSKTSIPLSGVDVIYPNDSDEPFPLLGSTKSGPDGKYVFDYVNPGRVITKASLSGYCPEVARFRAPSESADIALESGGATVRGHAVERLTGKGKAGAKVWLESDDYRNCVMSQADGSFEFSNLPGGDYAIYAIRGMRSDRQEFSLDDTEVREGIEIVLPSSLLVSGKVAEAGSTKILPGVRIWYRGPSGRNSVVSDEQGLFFFETMAIDDYTIQVHERGYLPVQDDEKHTTRAMETLTRPVPKNASSDTFVLRLKRVPSIKGIVRATNRGGNGGDGGGGGRRGGDGGNQQGGAQQSQGGPSGGQTQQGVTTENSGRAGGGRGQPVTSADVVVAYIQDQNYERLVTKTDHEGRFFVNMPSRQQGDAKILVRRGNSVAGADVRIPQRGEAEINLDRGMLMGQFMLADKSPVDGVRVDVNYFLPKDRPAQLAKLVDDRQFYTQGNGRFFYALPPGQRVQLGFGMPDGARIVKEYESDKLVNRMTTFIYDPVTQDIYHDTTEGWGGRGGGRGGDQGGRGGDQGGRGQNRGGDGSGGGGPRPPGGQQQGGGRPNG